ncbi:ATP phosphoribosyltransferase (ATP-PRTase) (ATP-PRT) [Rhizina undulata]
MGSSNEGSRFEQEAETLKMMKPCFHIAIIASPLQLHMRVSGSGMGPHAKPVRLTEQRRWRRVRPGLKTSRKARTRTPQSRNNTPHPQHKAIELAEMDLVNHLNDRLLFAVPKKGRLHQKCLDLLTGSDIQFHRHSRLDIALCINLPIALVFLPAADIPRFIGEGRVDLGITGRDQVAESQTDVEEILDLEFGKCKLQVQVPEKGSITDPKQLIGKNVVTSFTGLSSEYFEKLEREVDAAEGKTNGSATLTVGEGTERIISRPASIFSGLRTKIKYVGGSVEAACALGVADGIVDLVESGETMKAAGLMPIATILETTAILIKSKHPSSNPALITTIESRIRGVITAKKYVLCTYNIPRGVLAAVKKITPGKRAPTVTQLDEENWVAISVMVEKKDIATVMDHLEAAGAQDILVTAISNSRCGPDEPQRKEN